MNTRDFTFRHIGPRDHDIPEMLKTIGVKSVDELVDITIPSEIRLEKDLAISEGLSEFDYLNELKKKAAKNKNTRSFIGHGYYGTIMPSPIQRNILENPGWYTAYTPYQAEIAQGRLEALINFQTMVSDLTGMELANASLLDEATAAAEAMSMVFSARSRKDEKSGKNKFFVSEEIFFQTHDLLRTRAIPLDIELVVGNPFDFDFDESFFGAIVQYPDRNGEVKDFEQISGTLHANGTKLIVAADLLSLALLTPPGEWGADVVVGTTQRFGIPMGYGGPHAAYFATKEEYKRNVPGRIIGVSQDVEGRPGFRMALQTREQHIRRDKATSNICTAQALLAVMAGMYATYHGPKGLKNIALDIHKKTVGLENTLKKLGFNNVNAVYFDTLKLHLPDGVTQDAVRKAALENDLNLYYFKDGTVGLSLDEATTANEIKTLGATFANVVGKDTEAVNWEEATLKITGKFERNSPYLEHEIFNSFHSETELMRYMKRLENKDFSLAHSMIPLGSCTMKLNAATQLEPITWSEFANVHPFVPQEQALGYKEIIDELRDDLAEITGFHTVSLQPNSGAQGEYAGLMVIKAYHEDRGDYNRKIVLIPSSAHGTNPASAVMAGMKVVVVKCDEKGNIDVDDLREKAEKHSDELSALMVTYPSTHGVFERSILEVTDIIHQNGGQVYMDGANMNAQVGLTNPGRIGADVCHLNLHKTFAIPHGGGGPGMGPIGVAKHLAPFLPTHPIVKTGGEKGIPAISAAPFGSSLILIISHAYIKMLGAKGLRKSTETAILNANYIKAKLKGYYDVLYTGERGNVAHEMIIDCRSFKRTAGIEVEDIAKRLIDYSFHSPTVSFPVAGTLMIEPTESESREELDKFCSAMMSIRAEIEEIEQGTASQTDNVLKNAPHTNVMLINDHWEKPYSRVKAAFPLDYLRQSKFWAPVRRVDNAYGDRNLMCTCPPMESYEQESLELT